MGWLHWSEDQLIAADMNSIMVGYQGTREMLEAIHGKREEETGPPQQPGAQTLRPAPKVVPVTTVAVEKLPPLTPAAFDKMFITKPKVNANA